MNLVRVLVNRSFRSLVPKALRDHKKMNFPERQIPPDGLSFISTHGCPRDQIGVSASRSQCLGDQTRVRVNVRACVRACIHARVYACV